MNILIKRAASRCVFREARVGRWAELAQLQVEMPPKRTRNAENSENKLLLTRELRRSRLVLFIQQFEKEGSDPQVGT